MDDIYIKGKGRVLRPGSASFFHSPRTGNGGRLRRLLIIYCVNARGDVNRTRRRHGNHRAGTKRRVMSIATLLTVGAKSQKAPEITDGIFLTISTKIRKYRLIIVPLMTIKQSNRRIKRGRIPGIGPKGSNSKNRFERYPGNFPKNLSRGIFWANHISHTVRLWLLGKDRYFAGDRY